MGQPCEECNSFSLAPGGFQALGSSWFKKESRSILFPRDPSEFEVETGGEPRRFGMQSLEVRLFDPIFAAHLTDHEFRIPIDETTPTTAVSSSALPEVIQEEDQGLVLGDIVAA